MNRSSSLITIISLILSLALICNASVYGDDFPSDQVLIVSFKSWMTAYNIQYTSDEFQSKFETWKANVKRIGDFNSQIKLPDALVSEGSPSASTPSELSASTLAELGLSDTTTVTYPKQNVQQLSLNEFSGLSYSEFTAGFTGGMPGAVPAVAAALATSTIIAIAVGGAAVAGVAGGSVVAYKKYKKNKKEETPKKEVELTEQPTTPSGINVFNLSQNHHHSITARAFTTPNN
ncbi:hypothetical protein DFA_00442 [Cavenderia fasciculata]|uniref:Cathepsin propeptide inhibitor domain-containing protein n=1 Tax=Cavenderia fasciculata TaxID=261658 RepID=F4PRT2_CACFS|nr:uncharacterized protein DFA_00442 [Cavenderia fasciculata]EGG20581.1 hypothetical protein DFA_00442 [Cavenderia fasciculata]|eukprot:XP_004358431.1 hypothetical protein DFA_00442 [Cavenderia fasciculata]